jgi:ATP-dependent helicase/nuclease subunit A
MTTNPTLLPSPADQAERDAALDPSRSFICVAPAGSGKTELLTQRFLGLLAQVPSPESILAITFTRKAAAEMQARIVSALEAAEGPCPDSPQAAKRWALARAALAADKARGWGLRQHPARLLIRTFDSFSSRLVKALPLSAGALSHQSLATDPDGLYRAAIDSLIEDMTTAGQENPALLALLYHLDNQYERLVALLTELLRVRNHWLPVVMAHSGDSDRVREQLEQTLSDLRRRELDQLAELLVTGGYEPLLEIWQFAQSFGAYAGPKVSSANEWPETDPNNLDAMNEWQAFCGWLLTQSGGFRKRFTVREGVPAKAEGIKPAELKAIKAKLEEQVSQLAADPAAEACVRAVRDLPYGQYPDSAWRALSSLISLLPTLVAHLKWVFAARNQVDYTEMSLRALEAFGDEAAPTDLALALDAKFQHLLVDEFQDSADGQVDLINRLTQGWQSGDGRTLFCVGDAMQSIYAFREAKVGLFLQALAGQGVLARLHLTPLRLTTNFRSRPSLIDWSNSLFAAAFPAQTDIDLGAVPFEAAIPFRDAGGEPVRLQFFHGEAAQAAEASWVREQIQAVQATHPEYRIAVLGRDRSVLKPLAQALTAAGLRYQAVDMIPLAALPWVQDALSLTRAYLAPSDSIAWLALLRAPWCGLRLASLLELRACPGATLWQQADHALSQRLLPEDEQTRLLQVMQAMQRSWAARGRLPLHRALLALWRRLGGFDWLAESARRDIQRFFDVLSAETESGLLEDPARLDRLVATLYAEPDSQASDRLQIMTMHKSKGLEFDVVFLVGLAKGARQSDQPLMRYQPWLGAKSRAQGWLMSPLHFRGYAADNRESADSATAQAVKGDSLYAWLGQAASQREQLESCRLFYVAATRAREQLILTASFGVKKPKKAKKGDKPDAADPVPAKGSLLASLWPSLADRAPLNTQRLAPPSQAPDAEADTDVKAPAPVTSINRLPLAALQARLNAESLTDIGPVWHWGEGASAADQLSAQMTVERQSPLAASLGEWLHEALAMLVPRLVAAESGPLPPVFAERFGQDWMALPEPNREALSLRVLAVLSACWAADSPWRKALEGARWWKSEWALATEAGVKRLDLCWQGADGRYGLLDYKSAGLLGDETANQTDNLTAEQTARWREQLTTEYGPQLREYQKRLAGYLHQPIDAVTPVIYWLPGQGWWEL